MIEKEKFSIFESFVKAPRNFLLNIGGVECMYVRSTPNWSFMKLLGASQSSI